MQTLHRLWGKVGFCYKFHWSLFWLKPFCSCRHKRNSGKILSSNHRKNISLHPDLSSSLSSFSSHAPATVGTLFPLLHFLTLITRSLVPMMFTLKHCSRKGIGPPLYWSLRRRTSLFRSLFHSRKTTVLHHFLWNCLLEKHRPGVGLEADKSSKLTGNPLWFPGCGCSLFFSQMS